MSHPATYEAVFVHRHLPVPADFDASSFGVRATPEQVVHITPSASPGALRGIAAKRAVFVDVHPSEMRRELVDAIVAASAAARPDLARPEPARFDFGEALKVLKTGGRVAREGWNGKGMHLELQRPDAHSKMSLPYVFLFTACRNRVPWLASQTDVLAEDWVAVRGQAGQAAPAAPKEPGPWQRDAARPLPECLDPNVIAAGPFKLDPDLVVAGPFRIDLSGGVVSTNRLVVSEAGFVVGPCEPGCPR